MFAAGVLSIMAGILALAAGAYLVGAVVLGTSIPITGLWIVLFFMSSKRTFTLPRVISYIATTLGKERGQKYVKQTNGWIEEVCIMSRENLHSSKSKKVFHCWIFCIYCILDLLWNFIFNNCRRCRLCSRIL